MTHQNRSPSNPVRLIGVPLSKDYSHEQIASELGISRGEVSTWKAELRSELERLAHYFNCARRQLLADDLLSVAMPERTRVH